MLGVAVRVTSCIVLDKQSNHTRLHFAICKILLVLESSDMVHPQILGDEAGGIATHLRSFWMTYCVPCHFELQDENLSQKNQKIKIR